MLQVGGSIDADADVAVAQGEMYWDGTEEVNLYILNIDIEAIKANLGQVHTTEDESPSGGGGAPAMTSGIAEGC
jgi:hypothetical protein